MRARVESVQRHRNGTATLTLLPLDQEKAALTLVVVNAPLQIRAAVGTEVWLGAGIVMIGQTLWARAVPKTECCIRLVEPEDRDCWSWADIFAQASCSLD